MACLLLIPVLLISIGYQPKSSFKGSLNLLVFPGSSACKESACNAGDPGWISGLGRFPWRRDRLPTPVFLGFPCGSAGKESAHNAGDLGSIPGLGRSPREGKGYALQCFSLENSMDCIVYGVTKSRTQQSNFHSLPPFDIIRKIKRELKRNLLFHGDLMHTLESPKNILPPQSCQVTCPMGLEFRLPFCPNSE